MPSSPSPSPRRKRARFSPVTRQVFLYLFFLFPAVLDIAQGMTGALGPNPVSVCLHDFGRYAFRFLLASLVVTPLKRFLGVDIMLYRRPLGLLAFTYAALHVFFYVVVARQLDMHVLWKDFTSRPFLTFGILTFIILAVLAATSTRRAIRALGRKWAQLHKLVYVAMVLASIHYSIAFKTWHVEPFIYAALALFVLALRLVPNRNKRKVGT
ncbi:protein-methionine-sulfoxide reductase heme-binding subunit MsrQ [Acetobacter indonesiensis]|uniref:sulfite oxidase heme-binding subunit YedZ n=1 Tax=Acetobacter indonesiensis TaxID=104101 RepID=UPI0020A266ED|nr:protein-methionine-sulfoxide reductase heme-binding subunit MsrQ [Acetobacter indonesiensis]MCP1229618.1 sulfoxide reductase heme-binding subunit YedZ [Acetobacter indonesiensis]